MPWPVYTETFVRVTDLGVWHRYTVPAGRRLIIKSLCIAGFATPGANAYAELSGCYLFSLSNLASFVTQIYNVTVVGYSGQVLSAMAQYQACHITISGYLFQETTLLRGNPPPEELEVHQPVGEPPTGISETPILNRPAPHGLRSLATRWGSPA